MKQKRTSLLVAFSLLMTGCVLFTSCGSSTLIRTEPPGAKVYMNGEPVGTTPYDHYDTKIIGTRTDIKLVLDGYEDYNTTLTRNEDLDIGALIATLIFPPLPLLWIMEYKPIHTYELVPLTNQKETGTSVGTKEQSVKSNGLTPSQVTQLTQLKSLQDQGILTQDEFDAEKKKILAK